MLVDYCYTLSVVTTTTNGALTDVFTITEQIQRLVGNEPSVRILVLGLRIAVVLTLMHSMREFISTRILELVMATAPPCQSLFWLQISEQFSHYIQR